MDSFVVKVKKGRARPLWCGHPWLMSGAVAVVEGHPANGDVVRVVDAEGRAIGFGIFNGQSQIRVRMVRLFREQSAKKPVASWRERNGEPDGNGGRTQHFARHADDADHAFDLGTTVRAAIARAVKLRRTLGLPSPRTTGFRVVNAEGDGIPGLTVDRFDNVVVAQITALGIWRARDAVREAFADAERLVIVAPDDAAEHERIPAPRRETYSHGTLTVSNDSPRVTFLENGVAFVAEPGRGQKTGFYFDQRDARSLVATVSSGARVLDLFTHTGAFALYAARAGARDVTAVDSSAPALALARENAKLNAFETISWVEDDALRFLMERGRAGDTYDVVIVDPPKLARRDADIDGAIDRLRRLIAEAMRVVTNGWLLVSSCSAAIPRDALERAVAIATNEAGRSAQIVWRGGPGPDHPVAAGHTEGDYLKSLFVYVNAT